MQVMLEQVCSLSPASHSIADMQVGSEPQCTAKLGQSTAAFPFLDAIIHHLTCLCMYVCMYLCVCMYVCTYVCTLFYCSTNKILFMQIHLVKKPVIGHPTLQACDCSCDIALQQYVLC